MPEAEAGGPEIVSVSSTSKLSASIGVPEEEFINMQKSDPAVTLRLLLSKKQNQATTSSERTTSDSAPSNAEINSSVRQYSFLLRLTKDYTQRDVLKQIEENPTSAYGHLDFMRKLHNPLTSESTMGKVLQMGSIIDQFAKVVQKKMENGTKVTTQQQAHTLFYEKAQNAQAEADNQMKNAIEGNPGLKTCDENIAFYERRIEALQAQIDDYNRKIFDEQTKRAKIQKEINASTQELIDAKGREGIEAFSVVEVVAEEIKTLESWNIVVEKELASLRKIYLDCVKDL
jgi:chromosome segregation ATPase